MAEKRRMGADELAGLLADWDRPVRVSLHTSADAPASDSVNTTVGALRYPSAPITFTPTATGTVLTWHAFGEDVPEEDD